MPAATEAIIPETNNATAKERQATLKEHRSMAVQALNKTAQSTPPAQYNVHEQVWLEAKHLTLLYQTTKLAPKCHSPFRIVKQVSPVAYKLKLLPAWTIHPVFHTSLLTPYHETTEHGANYQQMPPEMIDDQEEYGVEQVTWWTIGMLLLTNLFTIYIHLSHTLTGVVITSPTLLYLPSNPLQPCSVACASFQIIARIFTLIC